MFVNKHFINKGAYISKTKRCYNVKPSVYSFYMRIKILLNLCICVGAPCFLVTSHTLHFTLLAPAVLKFLLKFLF